MTRDIDSRPVPADPFRLDRPAPLGSPERLRQSLQLDLLMNGVTRWRPEMRFTRAEIHLLRLLRNFEFWSHPSRSGPVARIMAVQLKIRYRRQCDRLGVHVPRWVVGPGFSIAHPGLLVVSNKAHVGARCRVHQGVTIGASVGAPNIGDDVFIGPNAVLIGPITIGDGAFIYPGAVCSVDVPAGHAAAGVPARVRPHSSAPWRPQPPEPDRPLSAAGVAP